MVPRIDFGQIAFGEPDYLWFLLVPGILFIVWAWRFLTCWDDSCRHCDRNRLGHSTSAGHRHRRRLGVNALADPVRAAQSIRRSGRTEISSAKAASDLASDGRTRWSCLGVPAVCMALSSQYPAFCRDVMSFHLLPTGFLRDN